MTHVPGGVCAAKGFRAAGIHCGLRKNKTKRDVALIVSDCDCTAAAVYTTNLVKGAPIAVTKKNIANGTARAVICNSGNANTCNADGIEVAEAMCALVEKHTGIPAGDVIVASTGVIGQPLNIAPIAEHMDKLVGALGYDNSTAANEAIMTTDLTTKQAAVSFTLGGKPCAIGGIAKGSGMISPNMATMLVFITTDAAISAEMLQQAIRADVADTFNMVSVDGDTSTNDTLAVMANGMAGNAPITAEGEDYADFCAALRAVTSQLCRMIAADGEGATKLLIATVSGGLDDANARLVAKSVIRSMLTKAAMFGADANWGRVLCAIGYSGAQADIARVDVDFCSAAGEVAVCRGGAGVAFSEEEAKAVLSEKEITIRIALGDGDAAATAYGCDLTYDYVKINGDYRT